MSPMEAMSVVSRERVTQYSRKYLAIHEISEWEGHLDTAKGKVHTWEDKVHKCEDTLQKLRREIEVIDDNLGKLESGMETLKHAIQEHQHPCNFVAGSWGVRDSESMSSLSSVSPSHEHDHHDQIRSVMGNTIGITWLKFYLCRKLTPASC